MSTSDRPSTGCGPARADLPTPLHQGEPEPTLAQPKWRGAAARAL